MKKTRNSALAVTLVAISCMDAHAQMTFTPLGDLPGGFFYSRVRGISADGSAVVGTSRSASGTGDAFRWTSGGGIVGLDDLPGGTFFSEAHDVSADGSVVVGEATRRRARRHSAGRAARGWSV
jgi:probable HAF family extracellular repeat protein